MLDRTLWPCWGWQQARQSTSHEAERVIDRFVSAAQPTPTLGASPVLEAGGDARRTLSLPGAWRGSGLMRRVRQAPLGRAHGAGRRLTSRAVSALHTGAWEKPARRPPIRPRSPDERLGLGEATQLARATAGPQGPAAEPTSRLPRYSDPSPGSAKKPAPAAGVRLCRSLGRGQHAGRRQAAASLPLLPSSGTRTPCEL